MHLPLLCSVCVWGRGGGEVEPPTKFDTTLIFRGGLVEKMGGGDDFFGGEERQFLHKK